MYEYGRINAMELVYLPAQVMLHSSENVLLRLCTRNSCGDVICVSRKASSEHLIGVGRVTGTQNFAPSINVASSIHLLFQSPRLRKTTLRLFTKNGKLTSSYYATLNSYMIMWSTRRELQSAMGRLRLLLFKQASRFPKPTSSKRTLFSERTLLIATFSISPISQSSHSF